MQNPTTSIRLPQKLRDELELASQNLHRGKNWIIKQALEEYLAKLSSEAATLSEKAHHQSILASKKMNEDDVIWEANSDTSGWH